MYSISKPGKIFTVEEKQHTSEMIIPDSRYGFLMLSFLRHDVCFWPRVRKNKIIFGLQDIS